VTPTKGQQLTFPHTSAAIFRQDREDGGILRNDDKTKRR
jgi:hypothetical protein